MKTKIILFLLLAFSIKIYANNDKPLFNQSNNTEKSFSLTPEFGLLVGGSYFQTPYTGSLFSQSLSPTLSWEPSGKFKITAGAVISNFNPVGSPHLTGMQLDQYSGSSVYGYNNITNTMLFVSGSYNLNENFTIIGAGWYDQNNTSVLFQKSDFMFNENEIKGMMLGFDYKVSENFRFGAEINVSSGYNPINPLNQNSFFMPSTHRRHNIW